MTALLYAARQGEPASVHAMLEAGADIDQVATGSKTSPLLIATMNGHFDLAKDLLARGAEPNLAAEPSAITSLYAAVNLQWAPHAMYPQPTAQTQQQTTHLDLMKALLEAGAENFPLLISIPFLSRTCRCSCAEHDRCGQQHTYRE